MKKQHRNYSTYTTWTDNTTLPSPYHPHATMEDVITKMYNEIQVMQKEIGWLREQLAQAVAIGILVHGEQADPPGHGCVLDTGPGGC